MKKIYILLLWLPLINYTMLAQSVLELSPSQSMSVTGKGPGQDAAINPYSNDDSSIAIVENIGKNDFVVRIQEKGKILKEITIKPKEIRQIDLLQGYELYLDSKLESKAKVDFKEKTE